MEQELGFKPLGRWGYLKKWVGTIRTARDQAQGSLPRSYTPAFWKNVARARVYNPIFIVGCPRSGTTMLGRIIDTIPAISQYHEPNLDRYYPKLIYQNLVSADEARRHYTGLFTALVKLVPRGGSRFAEKNPHNTFAVDVINDVFPDAKFIYIYRDGRDVTCSFLRHPWHLEASVQRDRLRHNRYLCGPYPHYYIEPERREEFMTTSDVRRCAWVWRRYAEQGRSLMERYSPNKLHVVRYEDQIQNPGEEVRRMLEFLDEYTPVAYKQVMTVASMVHARAIGRWRILDAEDLQVIYEEAGQMLHAYGYVAE